MRKVFKQRPAIGDIKTKSGFLFIPKIINRELRWLEFSTWEQIYYRFSGYGDGWVNLRWGDRSMPDWYNSKRDPRQPLKP